MREEAERLLREAAVAAVAAGRTERDVAEAADAGARSASGRIDRAVIRRLLGRPRARPRA
jgi:hypothetical protein